jgi:glutamate-1-semialdehyde aminotransferase
MAVAGHSTGISIGADGSVWTIGTPEVMKGGVPTWRGRLRSSARLDEAAPEYAVAFSDHNFPTRLPAGDLRSCWLTLENHGTAAWQSGRFQLAVDLDGSRAYTLELPHSVDTGESATISWILRVPEELGRHTFRIALITVNTTESWQQAVVPLDIEVDVVAEPRTETRRLRDLVLETQSRCWLPCDGVSWSNAGQGYPLFTRGARGCRSTDIEGRVYVDYLMGWGAALLGYANKRIRKAVGKALRSGAILTLTHHLMVEVSDRLCEMFPGAEAATFGKNGSDVCTAAVRLARAHTGRTMVLVCGYHGWQDWHVEKYGFAATGVPDRERSLVLPFEVNNLGQVAGLLDQYGDQVAAVMLEPASPMAGENEPLRDTNPVFLQELVALAHRHGALVIFDEIMSGFRHVGGSAQHATGVTPDLTCLGKALSAGMPLSALVGRRDVFRSVGRIFYEPTFKGEAYSFAAAREALRIYQEQDIPGRIQSFGERLRTEINRIGRAAQVPAQVVGPPFRMMVSFTEVDDRRRTLMRTLVNQELLKKGVLTTQNLLLPSTAHDNKALKQTCRAFEHAFGVLTEAMAKDCFASCLEIPPLPG